MGILMKNERNYTGATGSGSTTPTNLNALTDVDISNPSNNQCLKYDSSTAKWSNGDYTPPPATTSTAGAVIAGNGISVDSNGKITPKSTNYSTSEQIIGTWIDGKTLYQRTFTGTISSSGDTTVGTIGSSSRVKSWNGAILQTNTVDVPISVCLGGASNDYSYPYNDSGTIKLNCGSEMRSRPYWITVQYIK